MNEGELERGFATLELLKAQINNLQKQLEAVTLSVQEHSKAIETLENYEKMENDEILVPVGAGVLISAKVEGKKGLITIGNELYTEMPIEKIVEKLKERRGELENLQMKLSTDIKKLQENYALLGAKLEEDYTKYLEERGNVQNT